MPVIAEIISFLESVAHPSLQETYDNAGLIIGHPSWECTGVICSLDVTEEVISEAISKKCNLVVAHHPIVFRGLKRINGHNYVERTVIAAIKHDIAIYAIHTNLDNVQHGVSGRMAALLGLQKLMVLDPKEHTLKKLFTFVPADKAEQVRQAMFAAGAGQIGNYSECSFNSEGSGTFRAGPGSNPYVGQQDVRHSEAEIKIEVVFPAYLESPVVAALKGSHPYEEVAFDVVALVNRHPQIGSGMVGELPAAMEETVFLERVKEIFGLKVIRHTPLTGRSVKTVAVCGGAGSFLISKALRAKADMYITADMKYHESFDAEGRMVIADIGHYESEQFTIALLQEVLEEKFPTFAVLKTSVNTNPVQYF
ncbi:Nif3-like dinuclear metal center hexameric protein [Terrimonas sp. NA20]|uniref:GTP cyclohydrolase 1 type 2 homolog n=1 Tax=Terrimonas ginsenosidimutans TaxID=2908004 RepID=A0ABS9KPX6_9BACT|nr:Nif3-like dinuclear metal center hexameric protein [Terrimonas ginsenosidimutans]MCG2614367.1 Nif3-like dinuclear metal center hexameric protein [Terrimonas ginsenosidimutans]